jgi:hypothetical protein
MEGKKLSLAFLAPDEKKNEIKNKVKYPTLSLAAFYNFK